MTTSAEDLTRSIEQPLDSKMPLINKKVQFDLDNTEIIHGVVSQITEKELILSLGNHKFSWIPFAKCPHQGVWLWVVQPFVLPQAAQEKEGFQGQKIVLGARRSTITRAPTAKSAGSADTGQKEEEEQGAAGQVPQPKATRKRRQRRLLRVFQRGRLEWIWAVVKGAPNFVGDSAEEAEGSEVEHQRTQMCCRKKHKSKRLSRRGVLI